MLLAVVLLHFNDEKKKNDLPGKRPTAELLDENLTAVLNSFDICALPRVMFAPVLFLFHWSTEKTNIKNSENDLSKSFNSIFRQTVSFSSTKKTKTKQQFFRQFDLL